MPDRFGNYVQFQSSDRPAPRGATPIAPVAPDEPIEVSIYLRPRDPSAAAQAGAADARATVRADRERAYRDDIRLVADFAAANGLTVVHGRCSAAAGPALRPGEPDGAGLPHQPAPLPGRRAGFPRPLRRAAPAAGAGGHRRIGARPRHAPDRATAAGAAARREDRRRRTCRTSSPLSTISRRTSTAVARRSR